MWSHLREILRRYITAYNDLDVNRMMDCFVNDCKFSSLSSGVPTIVCEGKQQLRELASQSAAYFQERSQNVTNWIFSENQAALEIEFKSMLKRDLPNGLKAGQELNIRGVSIFRFEGDKIAELTDYS